MHQLHIAGLDICNIIVRLLFYVPIKNIIKILVNALPVYPSVTPVLMFFPVCPQRISLDKLCRKYLFVNLLTRNHPQCNLKRVFRQPRRLCPDRGKRRFHFGRRQNIVKAKHHDILSGHHAACLHHIIKADCRLVIDAEYSLHFRILFNQLIEYLLGIS